MITAHAFGSTSRPRTLTFRILPVKPAGTARPVIDTRTKADAALAVALALPATAAAALAVPPIHEPFTPLPCTGKPAQRTTTQQEGCAEQQILKSDKRIDAPGQRDPRRPRQRGSQAPVHRRAQGMARLPPRLLRQPVRRSPWWNGGTGRSGNLRGRPQRSAHHGPTRLRRRAQHRVAVATLRRSGQSPSQPRSLTTRSSP